jgi:hypothetical protein
MGRHPAVTILMVIFGLILLLPGVCSISFIAKMESQVPAPSVLVLLWAVCFLISAGGIWLLVRAFR